MKWTVTLVAEVVDGKQIEHEIATIERADGISPATVGLTIAEGKGILESLQKEIVTAQVQQHGASIPSCPRCGRAYRTKGYYPSTLRSVYGKVGMRSVVSPNRAASSVFERLNRLFAGGNAAAVYEENHAAVKSGLQDGTIMCRTFLCDTLMCHEESF